MMGNTFSFKKWLFIVLTTLMAIVVLLAALTVFIGYKVTNPTIRLLHTNPNNVGLDYEDVSFSNIVDNISLSGWWIPSDQQSLFQNEKAVIFSHGYGYNRTEMPFSSLELAAAMHEAGYHVFMFDFRNSGMSEKAPTTFGGNEKSDLLSAIRYVHDQQGIENIALVGWSMGAATSIMAGAEADEVKAVVADSPFSDLNEYAKNSFHYWTGLPKSLAAGTARAVEAIVPTFNLEDVRPIYAATQYNQEKGLFLIHSRKDGAIPYTESEAIHSHAAGSELWLPEKGGHIRSYFHYKAEYEERVLNFLDRTFKKYEPQIVEARYFT
ncbi:alpha/beta fold hydrolase [Alkalihalobacillus clausii]|uniref:Alpha/beta hydrolase n=3 Tax=Bacillaceae TaxID=186817 RepID=A0A268P1Z7_SHOCL|nr:alpha/beta fold hydrolase [Shouchella clausii]MBU3264263.1 alpha/beta fold hydrolase [Shouchella clausii]MBU3506554.1 alpha/beta fold hydrolase [Shouchella clausii]MBU3535762.1 alpha/beta fold hydrolase [Shouchella clausii]MBX0307604.1 alpha/beta fold hydrolase [Shouchella clausii]